MGIAGLPKTYAEWTEMRSAHLQENLMKSTFSIDLYHQYKKHLGWGRYLLLKEVQVRIVPERVKEILSLGNLSAITLILPAYKFMRIFSIHHILRDLILPKKYKLEIVSLDRGH